MIDLGSAKYYDKEEEDHTRNCGTLIYMPPERLKRYWLNWKNNINRVQLDEKKVDSWCLGLSIYEFLTG